MEECIECMVLLCCFVAFLANLEAMSLFKNLSCSTQAEKHVSYCFLDVLRCSSILQNATNLNVQKLFASIIKGLKGVQR